MVDILIDEARTNVLKELLPHLFEGRMLDFMSNNTLKQVFENTMARASHEAMQAVIEKLNKL